MNEIISTQTFYLSSQSSSDGEFIECSIELAKPVRKGENYSCSYLLKGIDERERKMIGSTSFEALCSAIDAMHWTIKGICDNGCGIFIKYDEGQEYHETSPDSLFCMN